MAQQTKVEEAKPADQGPRPIVGFLKLEPHPHLVGKKCGKCGAIYLSESRMACAQCFATGPFSDVALSGTGKVHVFSVVHQSFPGIKTPYITSIIDLPEGVSVRANLVDFSVEQAEKDPRSVFDLPVEMVTEVTGKDREGHDVVRFCYRPRK
jgi:uncharacterized OB-fold protein